MARISANTRVAAIAGPGLARRLIEQDGAITVTLPEIQRIEAKDLEAVLG
jgi:hypothetical protein